MFEIVLKEEIGSKLKMQCRYRLKPCATHLSGFRYLSFVLHQHLSFDFRPSTCQGVCELGRFHVHPERGLCLSYSHYLIQCWHGLAVHSAFAEMTCYIKASCEKSFTSLCLLSTLNNLVTPVPFSLAHVALGEF